MALRRSQQADTHGQQMSPLPTNTCVLCIGVVRFVVTNSQISGVGRNAGRNLLLPEPVVQGAAALQAVLSDELSSLGHKRMLRPQRRLQRGAGRRCVGVATSAAPAVTAQPVTMQASLASS